MVGEGAPQRPVTAREKVAFQGFEGTFPCSLASFAGPIPGFASGVGRMKQGKQTSKRVGGAIAPETRCASGGEVQDAGFPPKFGRKAKVMRAINIKEK